MMDADLERRKTEAEIEKIQIETQVLRRRVWFSAAEFVKVAGAIVATVAGLYAAITTYRITQLETRLAVSEKQQAEKEREAALQAREAARMTLQRANQEKATAQQELGELLEKVQHARAEIARVTSTGADSAASISLKKVSGNLEAASAATDYVLVVPAALAQIPTGERLAEILRTNGIRSGVNEPLKDVRNAPAVTELRFFKSVDREEADRILGLLRRGGLHDARVAFARRPDITRYRYFELRPSLNLQLP